MFYFFLSQYSWVRQHVPGIPTLGGKKLKSHKFEAGLECKRHCLMGQREVNNIDLLLQHSTPQNSETLKKSRDSRSLVGLRGIYFEAVSLFAVVLENPEHSARQTVEAQ